MPHYLKMPSKVLALILVHADLVVTINDDRVRVAMGADSQMQKIPSKGSSMVRRENDKNSAHSMEADIIRDSDELSEGGMHPTLISDHYGSLNFKMETECCGRYVCAGEGGDCCCRGEVRKGRDSKWSDWQKVDHWISCHSDAFGHTGESEDEYCECKGYCPVTCSAPSTFLNELPNFKHSSCLQEESEDTEDGRSYKPGETCSLECNSGYRPSSESLQCRTDRFAPNETRWSPKNVTCEGLPCNAPRNIANGGAPTCLEGGDIAHGTGCKASCQTGFIPSSAVLNCNFGVLDPPTFFCEPLSCGLEGVKIDFQHPRGPCEEGDLVQHGSQCHARCQEGYEPSVRTLTCELGVFKPATFTCVEAKCSIPLAIAHAAPMPCAEFWTAHRSGGIPHGQNCTAACKSGYVPSDATLTCTYGVLTPPTFQCVHDGCVVPSDIRHAAERVCKEGTEIQHNETCTPQCREGYVSTVQTLSCHSGKFYPEDFYCLEAPCDMPVAEHANQAPCRNAPHAQAIESGRFCTPHCLNGWTPTVNSMSCSKGVFDPPAFRCSNSECLAPNGIENAAEVSCREGTDIAHGTICTAQCKDGFEPSVRTLHCTETTLEPYSFVCNPSASPS